MKKIMLAILVVWAVSACKQSLSHSQSPMGPKKKLFLDVHNLGPGNVTEEAVAEAHQKDLHFQGEFDVNFMKYWVNEESGLVYCLSESPSKENVSKAHEKAHGLIPENVFEVVQGE